MADRRIGDRLRRAALSGGWLAAAAGVCLPAYAQSGELTALQTAAAPSAGAASPFALSLAASQRSPWAFQASGLVSHFREPRCTACEYRTAVPGIGLQRDVRPDAQSPLVYSFSGGVQTDSFGDSGGYAAAIASWHWRGESMIVKPGIGGFAFYRYMSRDQGRDNPAGASRELVPAILPVLGVEGVRSGLGAALLLAPNFTYGGVERSGFVFLQMTYRL